MTHRMPFLALTLALFAAGCDDSPSAPSAPVAPKFVSTLLPGNEVPPVTNADSTGTGTVTVTLNVTRDSSNNITAATADFAVTLAGFQANTTLTGAHIHQAAAGVNSGIIVNTGLANGERTFSGSDQFTKTAITVTPETAQAIINGPSGFYFNVHTTLNTGGAVRGQLAAQ